MVEEKIGQVLLDYTFYKGSDIYSDGDIEDRILEAYQSGKEEEILESSSQWPILYHISKIRENIVEWYPFEADADILEIGSGCGAITGALSDRSKSVTCIDLSKKRSIINATKNQMKKNIKIYVGNFQDIKLKKKFDYITLIGVWEYAGLYVSAENPYICMLETIQKYLKPHGKILIAIENKMGMKYWNGATEDHTSRLYSGMNDYVDDKNVRTFSKMEIESCLQKLGIKEYDFYYPMPDYKLPEYIFSDGKLPVPGDIRCYRQDYNSARFYNFYDATVFDQVCKDNIFPYFSNSFFVSCGYADEHVLFAKYSRDRKKEYQIATLVMEKDGKKFVLKRPLSKEAKSHVIKLKENEIKWKNIMPQLSYIEGDICGNEYKTPYLEGKNIDEALFDHRHHHKKMMEEVRKLKDQYLSFSEDSMIDFDITEQFIEIFGNPEESILESKCLAVTNVDMTFSNLRTQGDDIYSFDYEWIFDFPIPYDYVIWRAVNQLYDKYAIYLRNKIGRKNFLIGIGIEEKKIDTYEKMEHNFEKYVYGTRYLNQYKKSVIVQSVSIM